MNINGWKYYNHAAVPTTAPHEEVDRRPLEDGSIWKLSGGKPLLARWTTAFDCGYETQWWYVIKDTPFVLSELKAKRRYEINKGKKFFRVEVCDPREHKEALLEIQLAAYGAYPAKYRPTVDREKFLAQLDGWTDSTVLGAYELETGRMVGYAKLTKQQDKCINFAVLKTIPEYEKYSLNAALVAGALEYFEDCLSQGWYICDGARNINHETSFQDYLEKYFGFRKAYCKLQIAYAPKLGWMVRLLYPFRRLLRKLDGIRMMHLINSILKMEELHRGEAKE